MNKYLYFVTYNFTDKNKCSGFGQCSYDSDKKLTTIDSIAYLREDIINKNDFENVVLLNFIFLENNFFKFYIIIFLDCIYDIKSKILNKIKKYKKL